MTIEPFAATDLDAMLDMLARGMRDNSVHVAVFGTDPVKRQRLLRKLFGLMARNPEILRHARVARLADGTTAGLLAPGTCQPKPIQRLLMIPGVLSLGPGNGRRVMSWGGAWSNYDPDTRHWNVGPLAVDAHLQGRGIGSALMRDVCTALDNAGEAAYLETDKELNVRFYERFGFEVIGEEPVLATTSWYLLRKPHPSA